MLYILSYFTFRQVRKLECSYRHNVCLILRLGLSGDEGLLTLVCGDGKAPDTVTSTGHSFTYNCYIYRLLLLLGKSGNKNAHIMSVLFYV